MYDKLDINDISMMIMERKFVVFEITTIFHQKYKI